MILLSHPRSGSEFLLRGAVNLKYSQFELFNEIASRANAPYGALSFASKLAYLKTIGPDQAQKIHGAHLRTAMQHPLAPKLFEHLQTRTDLYFIKRENVRQSIVSEWVAQRNGENYHDDPKLLTLVGSMNYRELWHLYQSHHLDTLWAETLFPYVERFTFEDITSGVLPKTFEFDASKTRTVKRESWKLGLLKNVDQVNRWMDDLRVPGTLDV